MRNVENGAGWKASQLAWTGLACMLLLAGAAHALPHSDALGAPLNGPQQVGAPEPLTLAGVAVAGAGLAWARKRRNKQMSERGE